MTICGPLGILRAQLIPGLLAIPRSNKYALDAEYKYNVYDNNNVLSAQILRKASQNAEMLKMSALIDVHPMNVFYRKE